MKKAARCKKGVFIITTFFLVFCLYLLYGFWISKNSLSVRFESFSTEKVEAPFRILLLSDLHDDHSSPIINRLTTEAGELQPDLIIMCGDMINDNTEDFSHLFGLIDELSKNSVIVFTPGNEEINHPDLNGLISRLEKHHVVYLDQDYMDLPVKGQIIRIGGLYDYSFALNGEADPDPKDTNSGVSQFLHEFQNSDQLKILTHHRPDSFIFSSVPDYWNIDFTLSGHDHGGQIVLPVLGGLWAPDQGWFPDYVHGKHQLGNLTMFITSGISTSEEAVPRFNNPVELMVIDVVPVESR